MSGTLRLFCVTAALVAVSASVLAQTPSAEAELILDGVIVADNPADSIALVRRSGARRARPLKIGQEYGGFVLLQVSREFVLLEGMAGDLRLRLGGEHPQSAVAELDPIEPRETEDASWERRAFSKAATNERLEDEMRLILSETELTTRVEDGEIRGLELRKYPAGTLLSESGLLPGDVLRSINGEKLRGIHSLVEWLSRLAKEDEVRLIIERDGREVKLAYALTN